MKKRTTPIFFERGDILLTSSPTFIGRAIKFFTRNIWHGEPKTKVNHVGIIVSNGIPGEVDVIEALTRVVKRNLFSAYNYETGNKIAVFRILNLSKKQKDEIVKEAERQLNKKYGYLKIAGHLVDYFLGGIYFFRKLTRNGNYPICSWLNSHVYYKVLSLDFGVPKEYATPDDIWDYCLGSPNIFNKVFGLYELYDEFGVKIKPPNRSQDRRSQFRRR